MACELASSQRHRSRNRKWKLCKLSGAADGARGAYGNHVCHGVGVGTCFFLLSGALAGISCYRRAGEAYM